MDVQTYGGAVDELVAKIAAAGDHPNEVRRIVLSPDEMKEVQDSKAFTETVSKYYGDSSTLIIDKITTDKDGYYTSFYLGGILVVRHPGNPAFVEALTYPVGSPQVEAETSFVVVGPNGKNTMLVGKGNPANDLTVSKNENIELGLAIRKRSSKLNFGNAGTYEIALKQTEFWTFVVTVGSLHAEIKNICDLYNVTLQLDTDPSGESTGSVTWTLTYSEERGNYVWVNSMGLPVITDSATNEEKSATQMIQRYDFDFIRPYIRNAEYNDAGSPLGAYVLTLTASPKWKSGATVVTEVMADISVADTVPA